MRLLAWCEGANGFSLIWQCKFCMKRNVKPCIMMTKQPTLLLSGIFLFVAMAMTGQAGPEMVKPNILFIIADDQDHEAIGLRNPELKTPNLDRLAKRGTLFTHAYNQGSFSPAVCIASRAMLITGASLWKAAGHHNEGRKPAPNLEKENPEHNLPRADAPWHWPIAMKAAGYDTYFTGKWHVNVPARNLFDHVGTVRGGMPNQTATRYARSFIEGQPDEWTPWDTSFGGFWQGGTHWSEIVYQEARDFLARSADREDPFFMYIAFNAPHDPRQSPMEYVELYPLCDIAVPGNFLPKYPHAEAMGAGENLRDERLAPFPRTPYAVRKNRQEYYAIITHMDTQIGKILDKLEASGQAENTYIIFTSDHGLAVGQHGLLGKQNMYDHSVRVPLIISGPGIKPNHRIDEFVYLQDVVPTALEIAGAVMPDHLDFHSLMPLLAGESENGAYEAVYGAYMGVQRMIRTKEYKMILYQEAATVRLFNVKEDPMEMRDLASDPQYRALMNELFGQFKELQKQVRDPVDVSRYHEAFFLPDH